MNSLRLVFLWDQMYYVNSSGFSNGILLQCCFNNDNPGYSIDSSGFKGQLRRHSRRPRRRLYAPGSIQLGQSPAFSFRNVRHRSAWKSIRSSPVESVGHTFRQTLQFSHSSSNDAASSPALNRANLLRTNRRCQLWRNTGSDSSGLTFKQRLQNQLQAPIEKISKST